MDPDERTRTRSKLKLIFHEINFFSFFIFEFRFKANIYDWKISLESNIAPLYWCNQSGKQTFIGFLGFMVCEKRIFFVLDSYFIVVWMGCGARVWGGWSRSGFHYLCYGSYKSNDVWQKTYLSNFKSLLSRYQNKICNQSTIVTYSIHLDWKRLVGK